VIVPDVPHAPPLIEICGLPAPLTETEVPVLIPEIVIAVAVVSELRAAPVTSVKVKASGVASQAACCVQVPLE